MRKENIAKLLVVLHELRFNEKYRDLVSDVIIDECGKGDIVSIVDIMGGIKSE